MTNMKQKNKICIIGIDGATFDLIMPFMEAGHLPNIRRIISKGAHGLLKSSIPENSAPAWTSIVTGKNPGKHRVFGFTSPGEDIAEIRITNSSSKGASSIWDTFNRNGLRACVINVPLTYPPEEVDGVMISGMDTPNNDADYTMPITLKTELIKRFGRYKIEPEGAGTWTYLNEKGKLAYIGEVHQIATQRCNVAKYLLKEQEWAFFMVVFVATDRIQHKFWAEMDSDNPFHTDGTAQRIQHAILDTYKLIDSFIGEIDSVLPQDAQLVIVSDHGFGPRSPKLVSINRLLKMHGYLSYLTVAGRGSKANIPSIKGILSDLVRRRLSPGGQQRLKKLFPFLKGKGFAALHFANIDWAKTRGFTDEAMGLIWINRLDRFKSGTVSPGREYEEVCNDILTLLKDLTDSDTGQPILRYVIKKEDAYSGPYLEEAPDILFAYSEDYSFPEQTSLSKLFTGNACMGRAQSPQELLQITGIHRPEGIIILKGREIIPDTTINDASVIDVMPTCLYLTGMPISLDVDGRILTEAISDAFTRKNPPRYTKESVIKENGQRTKGFKYTEEEEKEIEERLKNLGYL